MRSSFVLWDMVRVLTESSELWPFGVVHLIAALIMAAFVHLWFRERAALREEPHATR